ncbi:uncharacterized protein BDZ99DRAFT_481407 [Mytilinidion resinicola]|uniref:Uncharacterized protein n=1 Tax=Mytilinidion resinicola TaxID=574789 RepID=A0A6A6Y5Y4_9PEZI|nr:uncharacterized protein BDZ99DRAFT_481407 [Mytilinidion resinicola]KAF2804251.1 hypothetical protein BDZ99DRAFT_481407 [Mytilinidion resinicola]
MAFYSRYEDCTTAAQSNDFRRGTGGDSCEGRILFIGRICKDERSYTTDRHPPPLSHQYRIGLHHRFDDPGKRQNEREMSSEAGNTELPDDIFPVICGHPKNLTRLAPFRNTLDTQLTYNQVDFQGDVWGRRTKSSSAIGSSLGNAQDAQSAQPSLGGRVLELENADQRQIVRDSIARRRLSPQPPPRTAKPHRGVVTEVA